MLVLAGAGMILFGMFAGRPQELSLAAMGFGAGLLAVGVFRPRLSGDVSVGLGGFKTQLGGIPPEIIEVARGVAEKEVPSDDPKKEQRVNEIIGAVVSELAAQRSGRTLAHRHLDMVLRPSPYAAPGRGGRRCAGTCSPPASTRPPCGSPRPDPEPSLPISRPRRNAHPTRDSRSLSRTSYESINLRQVRASQERTGRASRGHERFVTPTSVDPAQECYISTVQGTAKPPPKISIKNRVDLIYTEILEAFPTQ